MSDCERDGTNWAVSTDVEANRLWLALTGHITEAGAEAGAEAATDATIEGAWRLDEDFDTINDLSEFQPGDPEAMEHIERGKSGIACNGVAAVVRVMAEKLLDDRRCAGPVTGS